MPNSLCSVGVGTCLQITHGVRLQLTDEDLKRVTKIAFHFGFTNTVKYCEQQFIEMDEQSGFKIIGKLRMAVKFRMERYLIHLIKHIESPDRLMSILKNLNIERMSSESMKAFVRSYLLLV